MEQIKSLNNNLYNAISADKDELIAKWINKVKSNKKITSNISLSEKELIKIAEFYLKNIIKNPKAAKQCSEIIKRRIDNGYNLNEIFEEVSILKKIVSQYIIDNKIFKNKKLKYFEQTYNNFDKELFLILNQYLRIKFSTITEEANRDFLTGVYNRKAFFERLAQELNRSNRYNREIALLLIDLDNFKQVNDKYGHPVGDKFLKMFGTFLMCHRRSSDFTARIGGDEFAIILPETNSNQAFQSAQRIQDDFNKTLAHKYADVTVGLSAGIVTDEGLDTFDLYKLADNNLLRAKQSGRNRIIISETKKAA